MRLDQVTKRQEVVGHLYVYIYVSVCVYKCMCEVLCEFVCARMNMHNCIRVPVIIAHKWLNNYHATPL